MSLEWTLKDAENDRKNEFTENQNEEIGNPSGFPEMAVPWQDAFMGHMQGYGWSTVPD